jgi:hypothetical protein
MRLVFVSRETLPEWLGKAAGHLAKIVEGSGGRLSESTLRAALEAGDYWLAVVEDGACRAVIVCQPINWATGLSELHILGLTGEGMADWLWLRPELEAAAKARNFDIVSAGARPGWTRIVKDWAVTHVTIEKDLRNAAA